MYFLMSIKYRTLPPRLLVSASVDPNVVEALPRRRRPPGPEPGETRSVIHLSVQSSSQRPCFPLLLCLAFGPKGIKF